VLVCSLEVHEIDLALRLAYRLHGDQVTELGPELVLEGNDEARNEHAMAYKSILLIW